MSRDRSSSRSIIGTLVGSGLVVVLLIGLILALLFVRRIDPGSTGVLVDYCAGSVTNEPVVTPQQPGQFIFTSACKQLAEYEIAAQQLVMVRAQGEGQVEGDDSVTCRDSRGVPVWVDSTTIWRVDPTKAGDIFLRWPNKGIDELSTDVTRAEVRSAINDACAFFRYDEIFGPKRIELGAKITEFLAARLPNNYMLLESFLLRDVYLSPENEAAIQEKSIKEQEAVAAQYEQQKAEALAKAAIAKAEGDKQVAILRAEGEAEAIRIVTEELGAGTDYYIKYLYIKQWDGVVPAVLVTSDGQEFPLIVDLPANLLPLNPDAVPTPTVP